MSLAGFPGRMARNTSPASCRQWTRWRVAPQSAAAPGHAPHPVKITVKTIVMPEDHALCRSTPERHRRVVHRGFVIVVGVHKIKSYFSPAAKSCGVMAPTFLVDATRERQVAIRRAVFRMECPLCKSACPRPCFPRSTALCRRDSCPVPKCRRALKAQCRLDQDINVYQRG